MSFHFFLSATSSLSPSSHSQHLKISFYFLFPSFPGSSPSSRPLQFLSEDLSGHPILLHSVEFYSKNKFEKLVHPVGFITRIYHDARSFERQSFSKVNKHTDSCVFGLLSTEAHQKLYAPTAVTLRNCISPQSLCGFAE